MSGSGCGSRYDRFTPNQITDVRSHASANGIFLPYQHRYCEACQRYVPYRRVAGRRSTSCKGWKCSDCRRATA